MTTSPSNTALIVNHRRHRIPLSSKQLSDTNEVCGSGSFVGKLYRMVDTEPSTIVSWIRGGTAFCIVDPKLMAEHCLPKYFRHKRFSSLIRQLNFYSFYRVQEGQLTIYQHSYFRKGRPDLLVHIRRRAAGKAKDPWFDPLADKTPPSNLSINMSLASSETSILNGEMCFSPLSKPLSAENMSPALKPGMNPILPPSVDLCGSLIPVNDCIYDKRSERDNSYYFASNTQLKQELMDEDTAKCMENQFHQAFDIEIEQFLAKDCDFALALAENSQINENTQEFIMQTKNSMRNDSNKDWSPSSIAQDTQDTLENNPDTFEDELLLDLATVEPGAWEVPLSPLNEEDDMMPWLDLCFK